MAYCDYTFYSTTYNGNVIAQADFTRLADRASDRLDMLTFGRLKNGLPTEHTSAIKKCVCAMAEALSDIELSKASIRNVGGAGVASVSAGNESIAYNAKYGLYEADTNKMMYQIAGTYLSGTGLLYAGI